MRLFLFFLFIAFNLHAEMGQGVLEKYPNSVFVGTGIQGSLNINRAIKSGFKNVLSLEEDPVLVEHSHHVLPILAQIYAPYPQNIQVKVLQGNPATDLAKLIEPIHEPITFLLASYSHDPDDLNKPNTIFDELEQIQSHPIHTHTILIDNMHLIGIPLETLIYKLLEINPRYRFGFEKGGHLEIVEKTILVAFP